MKSLLGKELYCDISSLSSFYSLKKSLIFIFKPYPYVFVLFFSRTDTEQDALTEVLQLIDQIESHIEVQLVSSDKQVSSNHFVYFEFDNFGFAHVA